MLLKQLFNFYICQYFWLAGCPIRERVDDVIDSAVKFDELSKIKAKKIVFIKRLYL